MRIALATVAASSLCSSSCSGVATLRSSLWRSSSKGSLCRGRLQRRQDHLRHVGFSSLHDGHYTTIEHILVSEEFNAALPNAIGEVVDVVYLNDHLVLELPEASDHGQVLARLRLFEQAADTVPLGDA